MAPHRARVPSCRGNGKNDRIVHESLGQDTREESAVSSAVSAHKPPMEPLRGKIVYRSGAGREVRVSAAEAASALVLGQAICFIPKMLRAPYCR